MVDDFYIYRDNEKNCRQDKNKNLEIQNDRGVLYEKYFVIKKRYNFCLIFK